MCIKEAAWGSIWSDVPFPNCLLFTSVTTHSNKLDIAYITGTLLKIKLVVLSMASSLLNINNTFNVTYMCIANDTHINDTNQFSFFSRNCSLRFQITLITN